MNHVVYFGNLVVKPELKTVSTKNGETSVVTLKVAVNDDNQTLYIDVDVWGKIAEACSKFLEKGSGVVIEGVTLEPYSYIIKKDKDGNDLNPENWTTRAVNKVRANRVQFTDKKNS